MSSTLNVTRRGRRRLPPILRGRSTTRVLPFPMPRLRSVVWGQCRAAEFRKHTKYEALGVAMPPVDRAKVLDTIGLLETLTTLVSAWGNAESVHVGDALRLTDELRMIVHQCDRIDDALLLRVAFVLDALAAEAGSLS